MKYLFVMISLFSAASASACEFSQFKDQTEKAESRSVEYGGFEAASGIRKVISIEPIRWESRMGGEVEVILSQQLTVPGATSTRVVTRVYSVSSDCSSTFYQK
jgi:hypothetical protein